MQYKLWCTNSDWLPKNNGGIQLWQETADGRPKVPSGSPVRLGSQRMKNFDEITKGLSGFVNLWNTMVKEDISDEFRSQNEPLSYYWRAVRSAMASNILVLETLYGGFWPSSRFSLDVKDEFINDGTVCEEYTEDAPFVGHICDCPAPSFRVGQDVYVGYFIAMRSTNGNLHPFWVAQVVTNLSPNLGYHNEIQIQYWMPNSFQHVHADTYVGWNSKEGNVWYEDKGFLPSWSNIDCIMTIWKSKVRCGKADPKMRILAKQISIINASIKAYKSPSSRE